MKGQNQVRDQRWILVEWDSVPGWSAIGVAVLCHLIALPLLFLAWHTEGIHILRPEYQISQTISGSPRRVFNPTPSRPAAGPARVHARIRQTRVAKLEPVSPGMPGQTLEQRARRATAALSQCIRFRQIYGFYPGHDYQLPVRTAGEPPFISAHQVPAHFEQFVRVEVTIDIDGRVAEARIVSGLVDLPIQKTLLSAIREFKYKPATRDGVPIPSQLDIVVHIPS